MLNLSNYLQQREQSKVLSTSNSEPNLLLNDASSGKSCGTNFTIAPSSPVKPSFTYSQFSGGILADTSKVVQEQKTNRLLFKKSVAELTVGDSIRPHKSDIAKEGYLWTMKNSNWQRCYAILTYEKSRLVMQIYNDELAQKPQRILDLESCIRTETLNCVGYKPIYEFKVYMSGYELVFGSDSIQDAKSWSASIELVLKNGSREEKPISSLPESSSTLAEIIEDKDPKTIESMIQELTESMEMRTNKLGKMIYELLQNSSKQTDSKEPTQLEQIESLNMSIPNNFEETLQKLLEPLRLNSEDSEINSKIDNIAQVIEFVNDSQIKIVDLLTKRNQPASPSKHSDEKRIKVVQDKLVELSKEMEAKEDRIHDSIELMMRGVEKLSQQADEVVDSKDHVLNSIKTQIESESRTVIRAIGQIEEKIEKKEEDLNESVLGIHKGIQSIQNSLAIAGGDSKLHDLIEDLTCKLSLVNQRQAMTGSPERTSTNMIVGINEKVTGLNGLMESSRESCNTRLNSIDEKLRGLLVQMTSQFAIDEIENSNKPIVSLYELKALINDLDVKMSRTRSEHKSNHDVLLMWMNRIQEMVVNSGKISKFELNFAKDLSGLEKKLEELILSNNSNTIVSPRNDDLHNVVQKLENMTRIMEPQQSEFTELNRKLDQISSIQSSINQSVFAALPINGFEQHVHDQVNQRKLNEIIEKLEFLTKPQQIARSNGMEKALNQLMNYQEDMANREVNISQGLDSIQHTLSSLVELATSGSIKKVSNLDEFDWLKSSISDIQQKLSVKEEKQLDLHEKRRNDLLVEIKRLEDHKRELMLQVKSMEDQINPFSKSSTAEYSPLTKIESLSPSSSVAQNLGGRRPLPAIPKEDSKKQENSVGSILMNAFNRK